MTRSRRSEAGFTLAELMTVMAIVALLASIALPRLMMHANETRRTEGTLGLAQISRMQDQYFEVNGRYANNLQALGYSMDVGRQEASNVWQGKYYRFVLEAEEEEGRTYLALAVGNVDGDPFEDILYVRR